MQIKTKFTDFLIFLFFILFTPSVSCQVNPLTIAGLDSLKIHQFTGNLFFGLDFSQDAMQYLYVSLTASGLYVDKHNSYGISSVVNYRGMKERSTSNNGYVILQADLWRHTFDSLTCKSKRIHAEPFVMLQFDENRGIYTRWQVGIYAVPAILAKPKIHISAGVGMLYQFDRYDLLPPDYIDWWDKADMDKIYNAIMQLDSDTGFVNHSDPRFALYLSIVSSFGKFIDWNFYISCQQPFSSIFRNTPLYDISRDYRTPYPCITIESILKFNILKWLSLNIRYYMQHDRNQLTFYLPYYMYTITTGFSFNL